MENNTKMGKIKENNGKKDTSKVQNNSEQFKKTLISLKKALARGEISINDILEHKNLSAIPVVMEFFGITPQDKYIPVISIDENNWFGNMTFAHKGNIYRVEEIIALMSNQSTFTINFIPFHESGFKVTLGENILEYRASSVIIRTKRVNKLNEAFNFISKKTFDQRLQYYLSKIKDKGFFQYYDYFIYGNGDIKYKTQTINIAESALYNGVEVGRKSSFGLHSYYTPDEIWVYQMTPGKFFKQHIRIDIVENRDIIYAILIRLAKLKGGEVVFI